MTKKLIIGITSPSSVILLEGQLRYFTELGYETYLMSPKNERSQLFCYREGCKLLEVAIKREISIFNDIRSLIIIIKTLYQIKPDIVNFGTPKMGLLGMLGAKIWRVPLRIYTCRGFRYEHEKGFKRWILKNIEWLAGGCAHKIICISPSVKYKGVKEKVFKENKCVVINKGSSNGVNMERFNPFIFITADKQVLKKNLGLDHSCTFGFVGRVSDRKGILELYHAFDHLYKKNKNIRLLIMGSTDDPQISDKTIITKLINHDGIIWPGRTDNVPLYLSIMDVFVLPTWAEGFGNVLVQAAAMGIPVISTKATGSMDAVKDGYNGILVEPKSVKELTEAMFILYQDKKMRARMGRNGIEWAKNFDSKIIWDGKNKLYLS